MQQKYIERRIKGIFKRASTRAFFAILHLRKNMAEMHKKSQKDFKLVESGRKCRKWLESRLGLNFFPFPSSSCILFLEWLGQNPWLDSQLLKYRLSFLSLNAFAVRGYPKEGHLFSIQPHFYSHGKGKLLVACTASLQWEIESISPQNIFLRAEAAKKWNFFVVVPVLWMRESCNIAYRLEYHPPFDILHCWVDPLHVMRWHVLHMKHHYHHGRNKLEIQNHRRHRSNTTKWKVLAPSQRNTIVISSIPTQHLSMTFFAR